MAMQLFENGQRATESVTGFGGSGRGGGEISFSFSGLRQILFGM